MALRRSPWLPLLLVLAVITVSFLGMLGPSLAHATATHAAMAHSAAAHPAVTTTHDHAAAAPATTVVDVATQTADASLCECGPVCGPATDLAVLRPAAVAGHTAVVSATVHAQATPPDTRAHAPPRTHGCPSLIQLSISRI